MYLQACIGTRDFSSAPPIYYLLLFATDPRPQSLDCTGAAPDPHCPGRQAPRWPIITSHLGAVQRRQMSPSKTPGNKRRRRYQGFRFGVTLPGQCPVWVFGLFSGPLGVMGRHGMGPGPGANQTGTHALPPLGLGSGSGSGSLSWALWALWALCPILRDPEIESGPPLGPKRGPPIYALGKTPPSVHSGRKRGDRGL